MAGVRNLTQIEAVERARLLDVVSYEITLDLTDGVGGPGEATFRSITEVVFQCKQPGADTFIELAMDRVRSATLNDMPVDVSGWNAEKGLTLVGLSEQNTLVVDADARYSTTGQGMHRLVDPVDKQVYLFSQFETADAQRVFACFDQPDLKAVYTWHVSVPEHWTVVSNSRVEREEMVGDAKTVHFERSVPMSTYITALCAGPYHQARRMHDGIDLGIFVRASMSQYLDADDIFLITGQGFDFFHAQFAVRYPLAKYDQVFVPDFNAGAMENFGCVVHAEQHCLFRSAVTDYEYENRANTILHEMAHMWFGDLVTMRWWDDLWLNESFAEWASHWANAEATRFTEAWTTFLSVRKAWGYRQDQLSSTHPVYCDMPDMAAVEVNFDGITYAKGAAVIKQLVAYVGIDAFLAGLRDYFAKYAWANATFDDLLTALETACGIPLHDFATQWLETAQVNTLRPELTLTPDGNYQDVLVHQQAPAGYPTLRTHRIGVGLYDLVDGTLTRRQTITTTISGEQTQLSELTGVPAADVLILNDEDLTYAKTRLDHRSMATVLTHIGDLDNSLARAVIWSAAWDMVRDSELATRDYLTLICTGLASETDINLITSTLAQAKTTLIHYAHPTWAPTGWAKLTSTAREVITTADPGSGTQLAWARMYVSSASHATDMATLAGWLRGQDIPAGLTIGTDLRWLIIQALAANGHADEAAISAELDNDRTATGERQAATATALIATPEAKAETWRRLTAADGPPNWLQRALLAGFQHQSQIDLTAPYATRYFEVVDHIWATRDGDLAHEFVGMAYPSLQISPETLRVTDEWLAVNSRPAPLRRLVGEGRDGVVRALAARAKDISAA